MDIPPKINISCHQIPGPLEAYGDISGRGVILGFVISAWLTILILVAYYIFAFNPHADPFSNTNAQNSSTPYNPNPVDELVARYTKYLRIGKNFTGGPAEAAFHKCILSLADTQLITGLSILVSGYLSLKHGSGLSAYHWKMVVTLAWFSSVTHLSALTFLRSYLSQHPSGRLWRLTLMLTLLILLFVAFIPTGHFEFLGREHSSAQSIDLGQVAYPDDCDDFRRGKSLYYLNLNPWQSKYKIYPELLRNGTIGPKNCTIANAPIFSIDQHPIKNYTSGKILRDQTSYLWLSTHAGTLVGVLYESPAVCFFKWGMRKSSRAYVSMISSLVLLVYGYLIRVAKTFESSSRVMSRGFQGALDQGYSCLINKWGQWLSHRKSEMLVIIGMIILPFLASIFCTFRVLMHLYTSVFAEVWL
ncbi:hypothetical protein LX32DRAFT_376398 [Colletotrichum zoysiae]|uniref:Uncharacterized protein n=1 Tax=Colletotrichum zoysiae TaxID=1216348 RepID=A0AAD9M1H8_9PEZI|nr:hypothetical protein LX32DRAFT_376398 [Colletotrichum zoysiae]